MLDYLKLIQVIFYLFPNENLFDSSKFILFYLGDSFESVID